MVCVSSLFEICRGENEGRGVQRGCRERASANAFVFDEIHTNNLITGCEGGRWLSREDAVVGTVSSPTWATMDFNAAESGELDAIEAAAVLAALAPPEP